MQQTKHIPKDAQVIMSLLRELDIKDHEPRVINQLLEFTYREYTLWLHCMSSGLIPSPYLPGYVTCILDDAKFYANHARKKTIDLEDVKLASQMLLDKAFTSPPPRDVLLDLTRIRNSSPLPSIKSNSGLRLPADRYCLSGCNFRLKNKKPVEIRPTMKKMVGMPGNAIKRTPITATAPKVQHVTVPKPVFKFNTAAKQTFPAKPSSSSYEDTDGSSLKRKRDEDDFQIVE